MGLRENRLLAVHLPHCPGGRRWRIVERSDASVLRFRGVQHTDGNRAPCTKKNEAIFYFEAVGPGITSFKMQIWPGAPLRDNELFRLTVVVTY